MQMPIIVSLELSNYFFANCLLQFHCRYFERLIVTPSAEIRHIR